MKSKENSEQLKRLQRMEILSTRLLGGWLPGIEKWEHKHVLCRHLWMDAQHSRELRTRLWELRIPNPDRGLSEGMDRIAQALSLSQTDHEFLGAHYLVLKRAMLATYRKLASETYQVYDAPTITVLRRIIQEKEGQVSWAESALADFNDGEILRRTARWKAYIQSVIDHAGGIDGSGEPADADMPEAPPATHLSPLPFSSARRDPRFQIEFAGLPAPADDEPERKRIFQFVNYAHEMQAAETLGSILWETEGMDWEFYYDLARHCYDEARHSQLGETRLAQLGYHISDFPHCVTNYNWRQLYDPLTRYCTLTYVIEADSFKYKHKTYQEYLERGDNESAEAVLYDITDETLHVRWGQKWVPEMMKKAGCGKALEALVEECRTTLMKHSVTPVQLEYARIASGNGKAD